MTQRKGFNDPIFDSLFLTPPPHCSLPPQNPKNPPTQSRHSPGTPTTLLAPHSPQPPSKTQPHTKNLRPHPNHPPKPPKYPCHLPPTTLQNPYSPYPLRFERTPPGRCPRPGTAHSAPPPQSPRIPPTAPDPPATWPPRTTRARRGENWTPPSRPEGLGEKTHAGSEVALSEHRWPW